MRRPEWPYFGKRYVGNKNEKEVHDLDNEQTNCQIDEIKVDHVEMFDSLDTAYAASYDNCHWCLGDSLR
ncbi:MAG: hypothetical protein ACYTDY_04450 [Planctomycetota bacterium]|jgi:hypothetical protein